MTVARKIEPATYQDILNAPPNKVAELLSGELYLSPRPALRHSRASSELGVSLGPFGGRRGPDDPGGWIILDEPEFHFGRDVLVPDLAGWRRERMPEIPDSNAVTLAPDWVCEVASPSTQRTDRLLKMPIYRRAGVPWVWIVDPLTELVEVFEGDGERWVMAASAVGAGPVRLPPFDALELDPGLWFER
jgi:Uma2 family endonuclease